MRPLLMLMRLLAAVQVILGIGFWTGHFINLVNLHMALGSLYVLALWVIAIIALSRKQSGGLVALAIVWGLVVAGFGMAQRGMMIGDLHWIIRVVHLIIALAAMPIAERLVAGSSKGTPAA